MPVSCSVSDARRSLPQIIRDAEVGKETHITRRGQVVAVLIGASEFERLKSTRHEFMQTYRRFREQVDPDDLIPDVDEFLRGLRDPTTGREFSLNK